MNQDDALDLDIDGGGDADTQAAALRATLAADDVDGDTERPGPQATLERPDDAEIDDGNDLNPLPDADDKATTIDGYAQGSDAGDEDEPAPVAATDTAPEPKKDKGTRRVETLEAKIAAATRALREKERLIAEADAKLAGPKPQAPSPKPDASDAATPMPKWSDYEAAGKDWDAFEADKADWLLERSEARAKAAVDREIKSRTEAEQKATLAAKYDTKMVAAKEAHEDYDTVLATAAEKDVRVGEFLEDLIYHHDKGGELHYALCKHTELTEALGELEPLLTNAMFDALLDSSAPETVILHLAEHPAELRSLSQMRRASSVALAIGKIEERLTRAHDDSRVPAPKPVTKALPPPGQVAGRRSTGPVRSRSADEPADDYLARRSKEEAAKRRERLGL